MSGLFERILNDQSIVTGMLLIIAVGSLTFAYRHLRPLAGRRQCVHSKTRRAPATGRIQSPAHSRGPAADGGRWTGGDPWMSPPPRAAAGHPRPIGDPRPTGYPSWPGRPDPRWAAAEAALRAEDYPSWPERRESPWPTAAPPPARPYPGRAVPHAGPVREGRATEVQVRPEATWVQPQADRPVPGVPAPGPVWDAGSVQLATWILSEAHAQAAEIRHEARDDAAASLADAKKEAAELLRHASDQAAAKLAAAELEAAEAQAAVMRLSAELGEVASNVTARLLSPAAPPMPARRPSARPTVAPAGLPVAAPEAAPAAEPAAQPKARPAAKPGAKPAAKPGAKPGVTRDGKPRQRAAMRVMAVTFATLFLFSVGAGTVEVALHGFSFFVFRASGTGSSPDGGLTESQGPGQPGAPGAPGVGRP